MGHYLKYFVLIFIGFTNGAICAPMPEQSYWQCTTHDRLNTIWSATNTYQKVALNLALGACKKNSVAPESCKASIAQCEGFNHGVSITPMWQCTALDRQAQAWQSNFYSYRDDAALGAKAFCMDKSAVPDTCYINLITCVNSKNGDFL